MRPRILLVLAFLVSLFASTLGEDSSPHEVLRVDWGPPGVVWAVQVSDIHISKWKPERGRALRRVLGHTLKLIKPAVVLITGDLTEAKNRENTASYQYEEEWIEYRDSLQKVVDESGIPLRRFYDLRGNHDKYGVPSHSKIDYYSKYSISATLNRSSLVQSVTVEGRDGQKLLFVGFDASMTVGLRSPSNTFGHPTDELLAQLDMQLRRWDDAGGVTKIVYGHYPMSFTTSTESGKRPEEFMANNDVAAYLCGHLHTKFGRRLYQRHKTRNGEFWEWEVGDWRTSRMLRVLAVDNGDTSFVDLELIPPKDKSEEEYVMPTFVLQTHPLDSRFMLPSSAKAVSSNLIRALVFSEAIPISVMARIYDFTTKSSPKLMNESSMKLFKKGQRGAYYYTAPWHSERFGQSSGRLKYAMQIIVEDSKGSKQHSDMRFFSVEGKPDEFHLAPLAFIFFGVPWERVFPVLLWSMISFLVSCLVIPKAFLHQLQKRGGYGEWVTSVFTPASTTRAGLVKIAKVPFWVMVEGARNRLLWAGMSTYMVFLILFPWFSGRILGDDYPLGHMSLCGWTGVQPSPFESLSGLGVPDIMGIVLPYLYEVVFPLLLLLSALAAERVVCEFHRTRLEKLLHKKTSEIHSSESSLSRTADYADNDDSLSKDREVTSSTSKEETQAESEAPSSEKKRVRHDDHCRLCKRVVRKGLVLGCILVAYNHWRLCSVMLEAYGPMALVAAPAYAWGVPALLMITIFQTSKIRSKPPLHEQ